MKKYPYAKFALTIALIAVLIISCIIWDILFSYLYFHANKRTYISSISNPKIAGSMKLYLYGEHRSPIVIEDYCLQKHIVDIIGLSKIHDFFTPKFNRCLKYYGDDGNEYVIQLSNDLLYYYGIRYENKEFNKFLRMLNYFLLNEYGVSSAGANFQPIAIVGYCNCNATDCIPVFHAELRDLSG